MNKILKLSLGVFLMVVMAIPALGASSNNNAGDSKIALLCLTYGIEQMDKNTDKSLMITKAQAKIMVTELNQLIIIKAFVLDVNDWQGPGAGGQGLSDAERLKWQKKQAENNQRIDEAVAEMEQALTTKQIAFIDNLEIDPQEYGIMTSGGSGQILSSSQREEYRKKRDQGTKKIVALNKRVWDLVNKRSK